MHRIDIGLVQAGAISPVLYASFFDECPYTPTLTGYAEATLGGPWRGSRDAWVAKHNATRRSAVKPATRIG